MKAPADAEVAKLKAALDVVRKALVIMTLSSTDSSPVPFRGCLVSSSFCLKIGGVVVGQSVLELLM